MSTTPNYGQGKFWQRIQGRLILLLLAIFIPLLLIQVYVHHDRVETQRAIELQANLEIARAVGKAFDAFIQNLVHQEASIGLALTPSHPISQEARNAILVRTKSELGYIWTLSWVNPDGIIEASSSSEAIGASLADRQHFQEILSGQNWA